MNCEKYKAQIEELVGGEVLTAEITRHIEQCPHCRQHSRECQKLREMLDCLQAVNVPNNFNFHLKARMKQAEKPVAVWTWQRLAGAGTATLAALTIGFVMLNTSSPSTQTAQFNNNSNQIIASQSLQTNTVAVSQSVEPMEAERVLPQKQIAAEEKIKTRFIEQRTAVVKPVKRKNQPRNSNEEILVKDSQINVAQPALNPALPSIMPKGIPDPLSSPKKQDAREILRTLGVETETDGDGLRVTKSNRIDLQTNDVIEKVNGENPAAVTGGKLEEIRLTVRRREQTKEVKILAKP